ncbi:hypothetical protein [Micropruina sp.]|uniref:hypothetical protein n=1 Tax=Micropruina sp. TaxID=2737536 RepID=UPI0039E30917
MVLLDLADASWFPLVMVIVIAGLMYLLYLSMRHEIRKIRVPRSDAAQSPESPAEK